MPRHRVYSRYAKATMALLGEQVKLGRKQRKWSETELAERAGISRATVQKIEKGDMTCAVGLVLEVASLVGVTLFEPDQDALEQHLDRTQDKLALLPKRIRVKPLEVFDDF